MNNEPVAWMDEETGCFVYSQYDYEDLDEHGKDGLIPLYTHPAKTLTDEEIYELFESSYFPVNVKDSDLSFPRLDPIYFARAILRKAQEK
jgi:hypothetical protein